MRKKINKADMMYIEANLEKPVSDISQEIGLDQAAVAKHIKLFKPKHENFTLKSSRIISNGEIIGAQLSNAIADEGPTIPKKKKEYPNIYRTK